MTKELFEEYRSDTGKGVYDSDHNDMIEWLEKKLIEARKELSKLHQPTVISSVCISCDEQKETHELCMDCVKKMIKENQQTDL